MDMLVEEWKIRHNGLPITRLRTSEDGLIVTFSGSVIGNVIYRFNSSREREDVTSHLGDGYCRMCLFMDAYKKLFDDANLLIDHWERLIGPHFVLYKR